MTHEDEPLHLLQVYHDEGPTPENILVMASKEVGFEVEFGFKAKQYIVKKRADINERNVKTWYCSARTDGNKITICGANDQQHSMLLCEPDFFEKLTRILNNRSFLLASTKDFSVPICAARKPWER
jgi:hypothetical protein